MTFFRCCTVWRFSDRVVLPWFCKKGGNAEPQPGKYRVSHIGTNGRGVRYTCRHFCNFFFFCRDLVFIFFLFFFLTIFLSSEAKRLKKKKTGRICCDNLIFMTRLGNVDVCRGREWELRESVSSRQEVMLLFFGVSDAGIACGMICSDGHILTVLKEICRSRKYFPRKQEVSYVMAPNCCSRPTKGSVIRSFSLGWKRLLFFCFCFCRLLLHVFDGGTTYSEASVACVCWSRLSIAKHLLPHDEAMPCYLLCCM